MRHTDQSYFDVVWARAQDPRRAVAGNPHSWPARCMYRSSDGLACFVGVAIPDEEYDSALEGNTVVTLKNDGLLPPSLHDVSIDLMVACQGVHDQQLTSVGQWLDRLQSIADRYGLIVPEVA